MSLAPYTFLGMTQSLCPECRALVPAKIIARGKRVYFRKRCPEHGVREDFVCSDVAFYDRMEYAVPARVPEVRGIDPDRGCPFDCGLCTEHEQHTCVGLVELTSSCNLSCPMCYAASGPGGTHESLENIFKAIDRLVEVEGRPEILQLSGGEPTIHPEFEAVVDYALTQPIDYVMINTNGIRLAHDLKLVEKLAENRKRIEIYFQFDGFKDSTYKKLHGESLLDVKLRALENLGRFDLHATLVSTLQPGVNDDELGELVRFGLERRHVTGLGLQPATYCGRHVLPEELERRITFPDVIRGIAQQTDGMFREEDFLPLPCAHPNCHSLAYAYRAGGLVLPLTRLIDARKHLDLLANGISFTRSGGKEIIQSYLARLGCCAGGNCGAPESAAATADNSNGSKANGNGQHALPVIGSPAQSPAPRLNLAGLKFDLAGLKIPPGFNLAQLAEDFFAGTLAEKIGASELFRITITSFLDAYNFDVRRVMKCCTHNVLPSGHVIPFCAYNTLYRDGHVPLPALRAEVAGSAREEASSGAGW